MCVGGFPPVPACALPPGAPAPQAQSLPSHPGPAGGGHFPGNTSRVQEPQPLPGGGSSTHFPQIQSQGNLTPPTCVGVLGCSKALESSVRNSPNPARSRREKGGGCSNICSFNLHLSFLLTPPSERGAPQAIFYTPGGVQSPVSMIHSVQLSLW